MHKEYVQGLEKVLKELNTKIKKSKDSEQTEYIERQSEVVGLLEQSKKSPKREQVIEYLENLRLQFLEEVEKGRDPEEVSDTLGKQVFSGGMTTLKVTTLSMRSTAIVTSAGMSTTLTSAAPGPLGLIISGVVFTA